MKLKFSKLLNFAVALLLVLLGTILGYRYAMRGSLPGNVKLKFLDQMSGGSNSSDLAKLTNASAPSNLKDVDFETFWQVWQLLEADYIDSNKIDHDKMVDGAIGGLTASLGDPYTMYLPLQDNQKSGEDLAGSFYGVGIELGYKEGTLAVVAPLDGSPASKAGIQAGDLILNVKDEQKGLNQSTAGWSLDEAVKNIRGPKASPVVLNLWRQDYNSNQAFDVTIYRDEIIVESVKLAFIEKAGKKIAHLKLIRFGERTVSEWDEAVAKIKAEKNVKGLILDLRNNPGGYFDTSIVLASDFIKKGDKVVSQKGKFSSQDFVSRGTMRLAEYPLVILVNKGSASASEILAGALRDDLGAKLIGEKTFGKGTVQDRRELSNGAGIHITIAKWLLPKGDWIHEEGIPVSVEVKQNYETEADEVLDKALQEF